MKKHILALSIISLSVLAVSAQDPCKRHVEPLASISYCPPPDWTSTPDNNKRFQKFIAPDPLNANFNLKDESAKMDFSAWVNASIKTITTMAAIPDVKLISRDEILTTSQIKGSRVLFNYTYQGLQLKAISYFFSGKGDTKLVITATMLGPDVATPKVMDNMVKTMRFEP